MTNKLSNTISLKMVKRSEDKSAKRSFASKCFLFLFLTRSIFSEIVDNVLAILHSRVYPYRLKAPRLQIVLLQVQFRKSIPLSRACCNNQNCLVFVSGEVYTKFRRATSSRNDLESCHCGRKPATRWSKLNQSVH